MADLTPLAVRKGNFDRATLIDIMTKHIKTVVGHYQGKCRHWDVVNEGGTDHVSFNRWGRN